MKNRSPIIRGLLFAILFFLAAVQLTAQEVNSVVITFDPPIINGLNRSSDLFSGIIDTMNDPAHGLASEVSQVGAVWSASQNLSGVQFALFFPETPEHAAEICQKLLKGMTEKLKNPMPTKQQVDFACHLHQLCGIEHKQPSNRQPISMLLQGSVKDFSTALLKSSEQLFFLYNADKPVFSHEHPVLPLTDPTAFEVMHWDTINAGTFFSAKFLGEQFSKEVAATGSASYEILFADSSIHLILYTSGSESELCKTRLQLQSFTQQAHTGTTSPHWKNFAQAASSLLADDMRDPGKSAMFEGWLNHWHGVVSADEDEVAFVQPEKHFSNFSMPEAWMHQFSFSQQVFPSFVACSESESNEIADVAIVIAASNSALLNGILECFENRGAMSFPSSVSISRGERVTISFHSPLTEISSNLARIRARILNSLVEKGYISDLPATLSIGIAGVCKVQPLVLRGLLQDGWPTLSSKQTWNNAESSDLAATMNFSSPDRESMRRRWHLMNSSSKGKAETLAILAANNRKIYSFTDF